MEHLSVAVGMPQQILLMCCVRVIGRDVVHVGAVSPDLSRYGTHIPANQLGNLSIAQPVHIIFPYTTPLFYAKMMVVHTVPSRGLVVW